MILLSHLCFLRESFAPSFLLSLPPSILIDIVAPGTAGELRGAIQDRFQSRDIEANVQVAKVKRLQVAIRGVGPPRVKLLLALRPGYACLARGLGGAVCHLPWQRLFSDQAGVCVPVCEVCHAQCKWQPHDVRESPAIALRRHASKHVQGIVGRWAELGRGGEARHADKDSVAVGGNEIGQVRSLSADDGARARNCTQLFPQGQAAKV